MPNINVTNRDTLKFNLGGEERVLEFTPSAWTVLEKRYLRKDENGNVIETPLDMFRRVANNIAMADKFYGATDEEVAKTEEEFFKMMVNLEFLSGMALRNAGRKLQQLSACYVLPIEDSMESIYTTLKNAAFLHKTGAGIGYDFSKLRPRDDVVKSTGGRSCGPVGFMKLFEYSCATIVYNAATRRPGNMGILRVDHPDIEEFITTKRDNSELPNFNLSVAVTDKFMEAVKNNDTYDLIAPHNGKVVKTLKARQVFDQLVDSAWASAEPGIVFIDEINRHNPTPHVARIDATNQCGEQPLLAYEACNLGSIILSRFVTSGKDGKKEVDWERLAGVVRAAVHFLDNTIDVNNYPLPQITEMVKNNRKIGLGVMGFADLLIELGISYNSEEALQVSEKVMRFINEVGHQASADLAKGRGSFPNFKGSIWEKEGYKMMRNATVTTIAPNGTTSIFANCSSGIEPLFSLVYIRKNILDKDQEFLEINPVFEKVAKDNWFYSKELMEEIAVKGSIQDIEGIPEEIKKVFVTAHDIPPEQHIRVQATFQKYTDNAVSKTVNLPNKAERQEVENIFRLAYELGCKGATIYRDGSREAQVLNLKKA
ncbi:MAG: adenosylcobalamin-dependent ribonucleoside-diphosphate reductase [Patescibacteria group bacterium]|nr:adenosylcobalamin-dependent ribonucleoside-diphosphate reductase [Patescibacteria group bacterium]MDD5490418.1 adenosylcobalamin-dependent ribonucleoside-diphosphate reductase [Patescibacteria group bacterium]